MEGIVSWMVDCLLACIQARIVFQYPPTLSDFFLCKFGTLTGVVDITALCSCALDWVGIIRMLRTYVPGCGQDSVWDIV